MLFNAEKLSDAELRLKLTQFGFPVLPITATTRKTLVKKLNLLKMEADAKAGQLGKYSSDDDSDAKPSSSSSSSKRETKSRRHTMAVPMAPPAAPSSPSVARGKRIPKASLDISPIKDDVVSRSSSRSSRTMQSSFDAFDTGSDSEPNLVDGPKSPRSKTSVAQVSTTTASTTSPRHQLLQPQPDDGSSLDKINRIRSRMSLPAASPLLNSPTMPGFGTPYLSNFTRRLSQLTSSTSKPLDYKSDAIKEQDSNGNSYPRSFLARHKNRSAMPRDYKTNEEKNIFKNNLVSFALVAVVIVFFAAIAVIYFGMRSDKQLVIIDSDILVSYCEGDGTTASGTGRCVPKKDAGDLVQSVKLLVPELVQRAVAYHCHYSSRRPQLLGAEVVNHLVNRHAYERSKAAAQLSHLRTIFVDNPHLRVMVATTRDDGNTVDQVLDTMEQLSAFEDQPSLALVVLNPDLPWKCIILNQIYQLASSIFAIGIAFAVVCFGQKMYMAYLKQRKDRVEQIFFMTSRVIDLLQQNSTDSSGENSNVMSIDHVRDVLIPPQDRKKTAPIWEETVKLIEDNESRIRSEVQIVSGEECQVWRWVGRNIHSPGGNSQRAKIWQGQAFETQQGSVNSLQCSPTPCLKIRGMFDKRETNLLVIQDAVLGKCASQCKILHCAVEVESSCVYLKCANQDEAATAYRNLHGWWYDGRLVTVKYIRLERYMQRFPDSQTKGPPFLTASVASS